MQPSSADAGMDPAAAAVALGLLQDTAAALAGEQDVAVMLQRCVDAVVDRLAARTAQVLTLDPEDEVLVPRAVAGPPPEGAAAPVPFGTGPIGRIAATREPWLANDGGRDAGRHDDARDADDAVGTGGGEGVVAFAGYPLVTGDELVGVLGVYSAQALDESALSVLDAVADTIASGIRRAEAERRLREQSEVVEILYRVGTAIAEARTLETVVQVVTDAATALVRAQFGAFFYNLLTESGEAYTLYTLSGAPREAFERYPLPRNTAIFEPTFHGSAVVRLDDVTVDARYGLNEPYHGMPEGHLPVRSYLAIPVIARSGEVLGGLFFGHADVGVFDERAERIGVGIAGQAAAAIDSTRAHELEQRLALRFQRTLLSTEVPDVPGVRIEQRYVPASDFAAIGGDWHDVVALPDGSVALTIGDVVGHDLNAAVTMSRLRNAVQLYALDGNGPAETLALTERYLRRAGLSELATVIEAHYDPGTRIIAMSRAGHPPPVLRRPDGSVAPLPIEGFRGPILGVTLDPVRDTVEVQCEPGTVVVFFTDGLVERRGESIDVGVARLCAAVAEADPSDGDRFCDDVLERLTQDDHKDDIALVCLFVD